jgi:hypothetical protein
VSKIDTTFGPIPAPLIEEWGQRITFHKAGGPVSYNPSTGNVQATTTNYSCKAVVTRLQQQEIEGGLQSGDYKVIIDPSQINNQTINTADSMSFTRGNKQIRGKVIDVTTYQGDSPVLFIAFVRPQ